MKSFVTSLSSSQSEKLKGGYRLESVTCKEDPKTTEENVSTCTASDSGDTTNTGQKKCADPKAY